jgi:S-adenosyl-L-methionine hydrolase (adenosine-forming)
VPPTISFLSDYGREDDFVGVCHGVMARIAPEARVIDVTHGIPRHNVRAGALVLRNALPYMPAGVHLAIVDPEVGAERRAVAIRCREEDRILVGPDNGLLSLAWERCEGVDLVVDITRSPHRLEPVSATFHGRDIFAPVGAWLARGAELADAGDPLDPETLARVETPHPREEDGAMVAHALVIDHFGNVGLNVDHDRLAGTGITLGGKLEVDVHGETYAATYAQTFADVSAGELLVYQDAYRSLALAINRGDAAGTLALKPDDELRLRPR